MMSPSPAPVVVGLLRDVGAAVERGLNRRGERRVDDEVGRIEQPRAAATPALIVPPTSTELLADVSMKPPLPNCLPPSARMVPVKLVDRPPTAPPCRRRRAASPRHRCASRRRRSRSWRSRSSSPSSTALWFDHHRGIAGLPPPQSPPISTLPPPSWPDASMVAPATSMFSPVTDDLAALGARAACPTADSVPEIFTVCFGAPAPLVAGGRARAEHDLAVLHADRVRLDHAAGIDHRIDHAGAPPRR